MMNQSTAEAIVNRKSMHVSAPATLPFVDTILCGDSKRLMKKLPPSSINLVVTSPPYFQQREYAGGETGGERTVEEYIDAIMEVFHECVKVVRDEGSIVFNMGDKYQEGSLLLVPFRFALHVLEKEDVKLVNNITWVKSNPTPRQFKRRLVSSTEPFFHFVKSNDYYYNVNAFQAKSVQTGVPQPRRTTTIGARYRALIEQSALSSAEKVKANKELDRVIEEVRHGDIESFRMKIRGVHSPAFGGQSGGRKIQLDRQGFTIIRIHGTPLKRDVITSRVETLKGNRHPAIYPEPVIEEIVKLLTKPNDVVLDPYMGSGTTGVVAKKLGRHYIGFDINPAFCAAAEDRIKRTPWNSAS
jgi:site-specific DNA-methyltransferase (adenine-specific)